MASICLNELSSYNNGELVYKWFDLDDYVETSDFWGAVSEWLKSCPKHYGQECEEWNLADVEDIPEEFYGEYHFNAEGFFEYKSVLDQVGEAKLDAYHEIFSDWPATSSEVTDRLFCETDRFDDESRGFHIEIGCVLVEQSDFLTDVPEEVSRYFDYAKYGRDNYNNRMGLANGFVFWTE